MRGDGRLYLRGQTYWCAYYLRGREFRESTGETDFDKANKFLRRRLKEVHADEIGASVFITPQSRQLTVGDLLGALRKDLDLQGKLSRERKGLLARAEADLGHWQAIALTAEAIDVYVQARLAEGAKPATVNRATQLVRQAYRLAIKRHAISRMPHVRHLSEAGNERKGFFSREEFDRMYANLPEAVADFALFGDLTGWRKSEIASLTWQDVEDGVIRLRGENAKNREPRQVVIAGELASLIERRQQARLVNGVLTSHVFHRKGKPIKAFRGSWLNACRAAGVTGRIFHDLRRTAVRNMIRSGVPQNVAMKISGHKTDRIFRRYDICNEDDLKAAMESLERYREAETKKVISIEKADNSRTKGKK